MTPEQRAMKVFEGYPYEIANRTTVAQFAPIARDRIAAAIREAVAEAQLPVVSTRTDAPHSHPFPVPLEVELKAREFEAQAAALRRSAALGDALQETKT